MTLILKSILQNIEDNIGSSFKKSKKTRTNCLRSFQGWKTHFLALFLKILAFFENFGYAIKINVKYEKYT